MTAPESRGFVLNFSPSSCLVDAVVTLGTRAHTHSHFCVVFFLIFKLKLTSVSAFREVTPLQPFL